jgi:hypothetical protein
MTGNRSGKIRSPDWPPQLADSFIASTETWQLF